MTLIAALTESRGAPALPLPASADRLAGDSPSRAYYVNGAYALNGDGSRDAAAAVADGPGAWNCIASATSADVGPGALIRVHAGTYRERMWPQYGGSDGQPVVYESFGDGDVVLEQPVGVPKWTGFFYSPNRGSTGFVRAVNNLAVRGKPGSLWRFVGNGSSDGLVVYRGADRANGRNFTFQHVTVTHFSAGFLLQGDGCKLLDFESWSNGWSGGWFDGARNIEVRRYKGHHNNRSGRGNCDGLNLQDVTFGLVEDAETFGQYDGLDVGSQKSAPGCSFVIIRRVRSYSNTNTNFPNSTTVSGPLVFECCQSWDNRDWGSAVSYEGSRNVHYWNCTFADVSTGINYHQAPSEPKMTVGNCIFSLAPGKVAVRGPAAIAADFNCAAPGVTYQGGVAAGAHSSAGPVRFVDAAARDYRLAADAADLIDHGTFFLRTTAAGADTSLLPVDGDPRALFWPGDVIQIEGVGRRTVANMTSDAITLNAPATFRVGSGVHLPWNGARPDLGACEAGSPD